MIYSNKKGPEGPAKPEAAISRRLAATDVAYRRLMIVWVMALSVSMVLAFAW